MAEWSPMEAIVVRCKTCKHAMKFSAEKAGKRSKCPKCDTIVLITADEKPEPKADDKPEPKPDEKPAAAPDDDDDAGGAYGVFTDPEIEERRKQIAAEEEARLKNRKKDKKNLPKVTRKKKVIPDAESWKKVHLGFLFMLIGTCIWGFTHVLQGSYVLLGSVEFPEYANLIGTNLERRGGENDLPEKGQFWAVDQLEVLLGMVAGRDLVGFAKTCLVVATLLYFVQALCWGLGYGLALPVPRRFGMFGQLLTSLGIAFVNFLVMFIFKLLPVAGIISFIMIPFVVPEVVMTEYNMERTMPLHVMWGSAPFWENFLTIIFRFIFYLQPAFGCIFIWSVGTAIKDDGLQESARGTTQLCLGTMFVLVCFHLLSLCGATPVMVTVLRVFYGAWFGFSLLLIGQYALLIMKCRSVLYEKIYPKNELQE